MPKWCVRIEDELPAEECLVEADTPDEAATSRYSDLADWADMVKLFVYPAAEPGVEKPS